MGESDKIPEKKESVMHYILLTKDRKIICRTQCSNPPLQMPTHLDFPNFTPRSEIHCLPGLPHCSLCPAANCSRDEKEWVRFLDYLHSKDMVAIAKSEFGDFYILPPVEKLNYRRVKVAYKIVKAFNTQRSCESNPDTPTYPYELCRIKQPSMVSPKAEEIHFSADSMSPHVGNHHGRGSTLETCSTPQPHGVRPDGHLEKNYVRADPSYLQTLGQAHSGWMFGAIAELIDNSRDAKANELKISITMVYSKFAGKEIPMLSVIDDGHGMTHPEVMRMMYFGHRQPDADDCDRIGSFGVGFKTGAMRLGRDSLVLTQTADSRSIAFLSQSLNEGKDNLEIPIVSYRRKGQFMELDSSVQSEALAKANLKSIKHHSPFDKYLIGEKIGLFREKRTGTQIYIWNLDEWGSNYCLEWSTGLHGGSSFHQGDILIRSKRIRSRPGQMSQKVSLDYSLRSYLEVIFLDPRMRIYVQDSLVKCRPLAKYLSRTCIETGNIMKKPVRLTLGRSQLEWEQANAGIFLYWHGRLIEAYKRVGGMIHNGDMGRGVIGVIDVTDLMDSGNGQVWVHSNKQGFQDCEPYARLEEWLGRKADEYWDKNFDVLQFEKAGALHKPDHEWVQCDKCRKWRLLTPGFDCNNLPPEWFCYMEPYTRSCETPEQNVEPGEVTVSAKRSGYYGQEMPLCIDDVDDAIITSHGNGADDGSQIVYYVKPLKRIRRGLPHRKCLRWLCFATLCLFLH
ncbi:zf-CW domain-containing protein/HATPase_c_3 domain-containing protein [Cephalotus follicularis]|uniref:Zf-CW domain-containing protein/HATPase_c_3 domain-containing protein n=1 Tax=Cephalotus follicularis TaxID=3775 RepID=A0A1Q3D166_CEPFO|nr:zf-CW domain-containing protein/HATPase_c_3 domain-containing protein [Cephalotus follicularis]